MNAIVIERREQQALSSNRPSAAKKIENTKLQTKIDEHLVKQEPSPIRVGPYVVYKKVGRIVSLIQRLDARCISPVNLSSPALGVILAQMPAMIQRKFCMNDGPISF
jgi:hypothetical protein